MIIGGGNVGLSLSRVLEQGPRCSNLHMIEYNDLRATYVSETLDKTIVIQGDALDQSIMEEANIQNTQTVVSVTNSDETNILASLLAKKYGVERTITLVNKPDYSSFITSLGVDAIVSPKAITVSTILRHVRRGHVKMVHNLRDGFAEVMEVEALDGSSVINIPIKDLDFPKRAIIGAIVRRGQVIIPKPDDTIQVGDHVILLAAQGQAQHVEKMFSVSMDFF